MIKKRYTKGDLRNDEKSKKVNNQRDDFYYCIFSFKKKWIYYILMIRISLKYNPQRSQSWQIIILEIQNPDSTFIIYFTFITFLT